MPNRRGSIIANLNQQLHQYIGAGRAVQEIALAVTSEKEAMIGSSHINKLRVERDKLASRLRTWSTSGKL